MPLVRLRTLLFFKFFYDMKKIVYISVFALLALVSCNKQASVEPVAVGGGEVAEIQFAMGGEFTAATKAVTDETNLTSIYVTATKGSGDTEVFANHEFQKAGSGANALWKGVTAKFWPDEDQGYHFAAANVQLTGFTVSPTGTDTDIIYDYLASPTPKATNAFQMEHIFARVGTVKMLAPEGCTVSGMTVTLQPIVAGTFNVKTEAWGDLGSALAATSILPKAGSNPATAAIATAGGSVISANNDLWLVPGSYTLTANYTITKGDFTKEYTKTCTIALQRGKINNIGPVVEGGDEIPNIPQPEDASEIQFTVTIVPWDSVDVGAQF